MVRDCDVVVSNKSGFCHGIHVAPGAVHVCYCLAPTRYVWQFESYAAREKLGGSLKRILRPILNMLKRWDFAAAQRVDHFVAISTEIQERIKQFYNRDSVVIYPPVDTKRFVAADTIDDYFLIVSRLIPYKRIDLAVQACSRLALPLVVAGTGRDRQRLEAMAGPTVKFVGYVPDAELPELMARCRAFIFPGLEDFGIAPVQAQAAGRPVIAFKGGGALDTVVPGLSGELFETQTVETLVHCLDRFDATDYNPYRVRAHAMQFDSGVFRATMAAFVEKAYHSR